MGRFILLNPSELTVSASSSPIAALLEWLTRLPHRVWDPLMFDLGPLRAYANLRGIDGRPDLGAITSWLTKGDHDSPVIRSKLLTLRVHIDAGLDAKADPAYWESYAHNLRDAEQAYGQDMLEAGRPFFRQEVEKILADLPAEREEWVRAADAWRILIGSALSNSAIRAWQTRDAAHQILSDRDVG